MNEPLEEDEAPPELAPEDWKRLEALREGFLGRGGADSGPLRSHWHDDRDLALYDATFARRIAWKWRAVLGELAARGWKPPAGELLDWGCGSGVAAREVLAAFGAERFERVRLHDRSQTALAFAERALRESYPDMDVRIEREPPRAAPALLLASHVLNELRPNARDELAELARASRAALFVEPGEREASRRTSELREVLRASMRVAAPCTHGEACGALGDPRDWCHFFARPPAAVHRERAWVELGKRLGIDLRSLPYSYLLVEQRDAAPAVEGLARVLGRPRSSKADLRFDACDADGLRTLVLRRRDAPELHRALSADFGAPDFLRIETEGARVTTARAAELPLRDE